MVSLALPLGIAALSLATRRFAPGLLARFTGAGIRQARFVPGVRGGLSAVAAGSGGFAVEEAIDRLIQPGGPQMPLTTTALAPVSAFPAPPVRTGTVVTPGPVPVVFVKAWQAGMALFAIDSQGVRWVWRPKLGIWKRIRATRNIVISGKDLRRARRLVRISKRLVKMRQSLR